MPSAMIGVGVSLFIAVLVAVGVVWALRRRERGDIAPAATPAGGAAPLDGMDAREFEALVGKAFELQGYQIIEVGRDRSAGLALRRQRQTFIVLSKHWRVAKVGIDAVQALHRTMTAHGASGGFALTIGRFSREATIFAANCNIRLIEGSALDGLIDKARAKKMG